MLLLSVLAAGRVVVAAEIFIERTIADGGVVCAAGQAKKRIVPFRCIASGIAAVWWWIEGLCFWQKPKTG